MEIEEHFKKFQEIINKYNLRDADKAEELAHFLTTKAKSMNVKEFATTFAMDEKDAFIFIAFITKGVQFKEKHMDDN